jgi:hypothetical protein
MRRSHSEQLAAAAAVEMLSQKNHVGELGVQRQKVEGHAADPLSVSDYIRF